MKAKKIVLIVLLITIVIGICIVIGFGGKNNQIKIEKNSLKFFFFI